MHMHPLCFTRQLNKCPFPFVISLTDENPMETLIMMDIAGGEWETGELVQRRLMQPGAPDEARLAD